jgi:lycopene beta-cyclase
LLEPRQYDQALKNYISEILGIKTYNVADEEFGVIPMTNYLFPTSKGKHIVNIGSLGGSSKPSSGYTFFRIQKHVQKIVAALEAGKSPVISANSLKRYRFYDSVLLNILKYRGGLAEKLFSSMFKNNSIHRLFNFLDEKGGIFNDLKIITSLPPLPFARSATELLFRRRL